MTTMHYDAVTLTDVLTETAAVRQLLQSKDKDLKEMREIARKLLAAYQGTLIKGGASLAADRNTNPLIAEAQDLLGLL